MRGHKRHSSALIGAALLLLIQLLCASFFVSEFVTEVFGLRNWAVTWNVREILQVMADPRAKQQAHQVGRINAGNAFE